MDYFLSTIVQEALNKVFFVFGPSEIDKCQTINQLLGREVYNTTSSEIFTGAKYPLFHKDSINNFTYINVPSKFTTLDTYFKILNQFILNAINSTAQVSFLVVLNQENDGTYVKDLQKYVNMNGQFVLVSLNKDVSNVVVSFNYTLVSGEDIKGRSQVSSQNRDQVVDVLKAVRMHSNYAYVTKLVSKELIYKASMNSFTTVLFYNTSDQEVLKDIAKFISNSIIDVFKLSYKTMFLKQYKKYPDPLSKNKLFMRPFCVNQGHLIIDGYDNVDASIHTVQQMLIILRDLEVDDNYLRRLQFYDEVIGGIQLPKTLVDNTYFDSFLTVNTLTIPTKTFDLKVDVTTSLKTVIFSGLNISLNEVKIQLTETIIATNYDAQLILIFAVSTVTFDIDDFSLMCDLSIICPKWIVTKSCSINVNGKDGIDGKYYNVTNNTYGNTEIWDTSGPWDCSNNGFKSGNPGANGADGRPGQNGTDAYNFQGIGIDFVNSNNNVLSVHVNGGKGGKGSDGFNGYRGQDVGYTENRFQAQWYVYKGYKLPKTGNGGDGGLGGYGGWGGRPGKIILSAGLVGNITSSAVDGRDGDNGLPGMGGLAGDQLDKEMINNYMTEEYDIKGTNGKRGVGVVQRPSREDEKRRAPITMKTLIEYEKFLIKYLYGKGNILKDIAFDVLLTLVGGENEAMFEVGSSLGVLGLIMELTFIHTCYWSFLFDDDVNSKISLTSTELSSLYEKFLSKVTSYTSDGDLCDYKVLLNIYASALAALNMLRPSSYTITNLDYLQFFDSVNLKNYEDILSDYSSIDKDNEYFKSIQNDITTAQEIITQLDTLGNTYKTKLQDAINNTIKSLDRDEKLNQENADDIANKAIFGIAGSIVSCVGSVASNFGPEGAVVGGLCSLTGGILGAFSDTSQDIIKQLGTPAEYINFDPPDIKPTTTISESSPIFKTLRDLQDEVNFSEDEAKKYDPKNNYKIDTNDKLDAEAILTASQNPTEDKIKYLRAQGIKLAKNKGAVEAYLKGTLAINPTTKAFGESVYTLIDKRLTPAPFEIPPKLEPREDESDADFAIREKNAAAETATKKKKYDDDALKVKNKLKNIKMGVGAVDSLSQVASTVGQCLSIASNVENANLQNETFKAKNKDIQDFINTSLVKVLNDLKNISGIYSKAGSRAELDYSRFKTKRAIDGVVAYFRGYFEKYDFSSKATLFAMFENYQTLGEALESIYGRILDNYDKIKLARLITALNVKDDTSNRPYDKEYNYFKILHQSILIAKEGKSILYTARQLYFPDSISFNTTPFKEMPQVPTSTLDGTGADAIKVQSCVQDVLTKLIAVRKTKAIKEYCQTAIGNYVFHREFNNNDDHCGPSFCICRDEDKIRSILNGKKDVYVVASISAAEYPKNCEAIKFSEIYVKFYGGASESIEKQLSGYQFALKSSGLYDYKYNDKIYRISNVTVSPTSDYFCTKDERNHRLDGFNDTYKKLKDAAPLFSPYTTWNISMISIRGKTQQINFGKFDLRGVELHLVGDATYLDCSLSFQHESLHDVVTISPDYDTFSI